MLPPGPTTPGIRQTFAYGLRPLEFLEDAWRTYGDAFSIRLVHEGTWVVLADPAAAAEVLRASPDISRAGEANAFLKPLLGPASVVVADGEDHLAKRRAATRLLGRADVQRIAAAAPRRLAQRRADRRAAADAGAHARGHPRGGVRRRPAGRGSGPVAAGAPALRDAALGPARHRALRLRRRDAPSGPDRTAAGGPAAHPGRGGRRRDRRAAAHAAHRRPRHHREPARVGRRPARPQPIVPRAPAGR